jgi:Gram-negative bacterial TonB protein C-terminal
MRSLLQLTVLIAVAAYAAKSHGQDEMAPPPPPPTQKFGSITEDDYPPSAIRVGEFGTVNVTYTVGRDGRVSICKATSLPELPALQDHSCRIIMRRFRYYPATDERGELISSVVTRRIKWVLPVDFTLERPFRFVEKGSGMPILLRLYVSSKGRVLNCSVSGDPPIEVEQQISLCAHVKATKVFKVEKRGGTAKASAFIDQPFWLAATMKAEPEPLDGAVADAAAAAAASTAPK